MVSWGLPLCGLHDLGHCDVVSGEVDDGYKPKQISTAAMPSYEGGRCVQKGQRKGITTKRLEHIMPSHWGFNAKLA